MIKGIAGQLRHDPLLKEGCNGIQVPDDQGEINDMHWLDDWHFDRKVGTWHDACMLH
jgi:hypothetical protein